MRKTVRTVSTHVRQCPLCSQKGFICEGCHGNNIIYPFDLRDTYQCPSCSAVYHYVCTPEKGNCSKCLCIHRRRQALCSDF
ncbi:Pleckstrin homology domain-containing family M member 3 [Geodia barretti]|uniref:Pleckstrin homology domain-containing family M member 3 n=1 Tax=Geodia barretti TaxID=519541 RepID=A0AA35SNL9_GEOBA|nr:Pleckstrin homology domain-containing family M member 3 [Geodia barretti]